MNPLSTDFIKLPFLVRSLQSVSSVILTFLEVVDQINGVKCMFIFVDPFTHTNAIWLRITSDLYNIV